MRTLTSMVLMLLVISFSPYSAHSDGKQTCMQKVEAKLAQLGDERAISPDSMDERIAGMIRAMAQNILENHNARLLSIKVIGGKKAYLAHYSSKSDAIEVVLDVLTDQYASLIAYRLNSFSRSVYKCVGL